MSAIWQISYFFVANLKINRLFIFIVLYHQVGVNSSTVSILFY